MKALELFALVFISAIFILSIIGSFLGINYLTTTITELGFFPDCLFIHNTFAAITFIGGGALIIIYSIKNKRYYDLFYILPFILFACTFEPIWEWLSFWLLCIWFFKEILFDLVVRVEIFYKFYRA